VCRRSKHGDFIGVAVKGVARREEVKKAKVTLADASEEYLEEFLREKKTGSQEISYHNYILTYLKDHDPRDITGPDLQYVIKQAGNGKNPKFNYRTTAHQVGKAIARFWRWTKQAGYVDSTEVSRDLKRPGMRKSTRYYSDKELVTYLKDANPAIQAIAYCPMRGSELLRLNWDHFEGARDDGGWHNVRVKSTDDEEHIVRFWLTPEFMRYVSPDEGYFFRGRWGKAPLTQNSLSEMFRNRRKKLDIGQDRDGVHIFRKNLSTWAQSEGFPDRKWRMCLGHSIPGLTGVYGLHKYLDEKRERWAKHLDELTGV
jgi:integrase